MFERPFFQTLEPGMEGEEDLLGTGDAGDSDHSSDSDEAGGSPE